MKTTLIVSTSFCFAAIAFSQPRDYPRDIFNTGGTVSDTKPFPAYDPYRLSELYGKRHEVELQMFDTINEAALIRDKKLKYGLNLYGKSLGYIPSLAAAHYRWVLGDQSALDWLIKEDKKDGWGADSLTIMVFAYMDEWDKTIRALKQRDAYLSKGPGGATDEILDRAIHIRKTLYGADRFEKAWKAAKVE